MKKKESRIPTSNYFKLALIMILTIAGVIAFRNFYLNGKYYEESEPLIREYVLTEVKEKQELDNYVRENLGAIIYICEANNPKCREFEKEFGPLIRKKQLESRITYLNITDIEDKQDFIKKFNESYNTKVLGYPSIVLFEDGKVKDILSVESDKKLSISEVKQFLKDNNISSDEYD